MSKNKTIVLSLLTFLLLAGSAFADCSECGSLASIKEQFLKSTPSGSAPSATKERRQLEIQETTLLHSGAAVVMKILRNKTPSREQLTAVADFLAHTAPRDHQNLVLDSVLGDLEKDFPRAMLKVETALVRLKREKKITPAQAEAVAVALEITRAAGRDDN